MSDTTSGNSLGTGRLIAVPAVFTLAITILRLVGELQHWGAPWFNSAAGGGGAIVGISWLPIFFGPYFAWKLAAADEGPAGAGRAILWALVALVVFVGGGVAFGIGLSKHLTALLVLGLLLALGSAFVPAKGWRRLGNVMLAYAFAARIPVLIVMYVAMSANGGLGWGTHYDVAGPEFASAHFTFWTKFVYLAVFPQMSLWIGWTVVVGALLGGILVAIFHPGRRTAAATA